MSKKQLEAAIFLTFARTWSSPVVRRTSLRDLSQGHIEGGQGGHNSPGAKSLWGRRKYQQC